MDRRLSEAPPFTFTTTRADGLVIDTDVTRLDLDRVTAWLDTSYWAAGRPRAVVERSIQNSMPFGVYSAAGEQVAFARVVTDLATFAWLADVFVDAAWRAQGIGHWLVGQVVAQMEGVGVQRLLLGTRDAHRVYADVGFEPLPVPDVYMVIDRRATRASAADVHL